MGSEIFAHYSRKDGSVTIILLVLGGTICVYTGYNAGIYRTFKILDDYQKALKDSEVKELWNKLINGARKHDEHRNR